MLATSVAALALASVSHLALLTAAVAAAHSPPRALVNGRIAPLLAHWFAKVSDTAAALAFNATASVFDDFDGEEEGGGCCYCHSRGEDN